MDRRENAPHESAYQQDLKAQEQAVVYDDMVVENGKSFRVPYKMVKQVYFSNLKKEELIDLEHVARLQYRLLLMAPIIKAKVEFAKLRIWIVYNPTDAPNRKEKISVEGLMDFLASEGVNVEKTAMEISDYDYYKDMYAYQFDPPSIREHAPYSYSMEEWKKMKAEWLRSTAKNEQEKIDTFHAWQKTYLTQHPELAAEYGIKLEETKPTLKEKIFGKKKGTGGQKNEKGFWFHGV